MSPLRSTARSPIQSGAAVAGATVTAKSVERGITYTAVSNDAGLYRISQLPVGNYELRVEKQGFQTTSILHSPWC